MITERTTRQIQSALVLCLLCMFCSTTQAQIYKSVDKEGKVTYSDQASPDANEVAPKPPNTAKAIEVSPQPVAPAAEEKAPVYNSVTITSHSNDSVIANGLVPFTVSAKTTPPLLDNHLLRLSIDGSFHSAGRDSFQVKGLPRGEHFLQVIAVDGQGSPLEQSEQIRLFVHRPSSN